LNFAPGFNKHATESQKMGKNRKKTKNNNTLTLKKKKTKQTNIKQKIEAFLMICQFNEKLEHKLYMDTYYYPPPMNKYIHTYLYNTDTYMYTY
jgi:hypothetical protein